MPQKRDNTGVLFRNTKKAKPSQPDYTGNCTIAGSDYRISGWIKKIESNPASFISFAFKPKEQP